MRAARLALCSLALVALSSAAGAQAATKKPAPAPAKKPAAGGMAGMQHGQGGMMGMHQMMLDHMVGDLERQRKNVLDYVNVAPDSMLGFRTTPGVRTYAQQLEHIASATAGIVGQSLGATDKPVAPDTARIYHDKAALAAYVTASFDYAIKAVKDARPQAFMAEKSMFGMTRTGMRWVAGAAEHNAWTLGQTVPYLRMNGVTPPSYLPF